MPKNSGPAPRTAQKMSAFSVGLARWTSPSARTTSTLSTLKQATPQAPAGVANGEAQAAAQQQASPSQAAVPAPAPASELNGLALAWAIVRDWLRGLFSRHTA